MKDVVSYSYDKENKDWYVETVEGNEQWSDEVIIEDVFENSNHVFYKKDNMNDFLNVK